MPLFLVVAGLLLIVSGVRGQTAHLFGLIKDDALDFSGIAAVIIFIGIIGYVDRLKPIANGFIILILVSLFLRYGSRFFQNLRG